MYMKAYITPLFIIAAFLALPLISAGIFTDNGNGTVTDNRTGLMWAKNADIAGRGMAYDDAVKWVKTLHIGGYGDWRLPSKDELNFFANGKIAPIGTNTKDPAINDLLKKTFAGYQEGIYWTSELERDRPDSVAAWFVSVSNGYVSCSYRSNDHSVWPVRGGR